MLLDPAGNTYLQEWIVLNPRAIESFTADPAVIKPVLQAHRERMMVPGFRFQEPEIHSYNLSVNSQAGRAQILQALESYLGDSGVGAASSSCVRNSLFR